MTSSNPLVSIGIPTRNRSASLRESLKQIVAQDYSPLEIIISDNCSEDDTEQVCREAMAADCRIRYVRQPRNIGLHANHNFCIDQSRGEFLCLFHDHDHHDARIISEYVAFMQAHPHVGIVCADWDLIDDAGVSLGTRVWKGRAVTPGLEYVTQTIRSGRSSVGTPGAMVRRQALGTTRFGVDAPIGFGDFPIWFRVAETWDVGHIGRRLWSWRQNRVSHSARPIQDIVCDFEQNVGGYCSDYLARRPEQARLVRRWQASMLRYLFWAQAYEVGLHFRPIGRPVTPRYRTLFEIMDYRLTPSQLNQALAQMRRFRTGPLEHAVCAAVSLLVRYGVTSPLGWMIRHQAAVRSVLGLR